MGDYARFCEMLMLGGQSALGTRIISKKTLAWMTSNHLALPSTGEACDMDKIAAPGYSEVRCTFGSPSMLNMLQARG